MSDERRAWRRIPKIPELARTPVDRALALGWGGDVDAAAADTGYAAGSWRVWRVRQGGDFTADQRELVETALARKGWALDPEYLTGRGAMERPARTSPDEALAALEARRAAA